LDQKRSTVLAGLPMLDLSILDRHERICLAYSGGKDSTACVYLLRDHLDRINVVHVDTGDLLPEMRESVARVEAFAPHFVRIQTNVGQWIDDHGLPSDLIPHSQHPIGRQMGEAGTVLVPRYTCCWENLMLPLWQWAQDNDCTLLIRGSKSADMNRLPVASGEWQEGVQLWLPLQSWSHDDVFAYLRSEGVELPRPYEHSVNSFECARCSGWLGERRASYLQAYHPDLYADYRARMQLVLRELQRPMTTFANEIAQMGGLQAMLGDSP